MCKAIGILAFFLVDNVGARRVNESAVLPHDPGCLRYRRSRATETALGGLCHDGRFIGRSPRVGTQSPKQKSPVLWAQRLAVRYRFYLRFRRQPTAKATQPSSDQTMRLVGSGMTESAVVTVSLGRSASVAASSLWNTAPSVDVLTTRKPKFDAPSLQS